MNTKSHIRPLSPLVALVLVWLAPIVAWAHPGHHHPVGGEGWFQILRSDYLHLHGWFEISLALLAIGAVVVFLINRKRPVRVAAALTFCGAIALIAVA